MTQLKPEPGPPVKPFCSDVPTIASVASVAPPILACRRIHHEPADPLLGPFELDRHRIITCTAFRRLDHKTQVFAPSHHDHFRTRLTHTLEAAVIARTLARHLNADQDLAESVTLAHDLGHPPFGHAGEVALNETMTAHGGFNHNAHTVRVVEFLEHPFAAFRGLNLTFATLDGLRAHETRYDRPDRIAASGSVSGGAEVQGDHPGIETQIASLADRVSYNCHDLEDAIGAGFIDLDQLHEVQLWRNAMTACSLSAGQSMLPRIRRQVLDAMLAAVLLDIVETSRPLVPPGPAARGQSPPSTSRPHAAAIAASPQAPTIAGSPHARAIAASPQVSASAALPQAPAIAASPSMDARLAELEAFLLTRVYRHPDIAATDAEGRRMIQALFDAYRRKPSELPPRFAARVADQGLDRVTCDYIAGMTDRYCRSEFTRLHP